MMRCFALPCRWYNNWGQVSTLAILLLILVTACGHVYKGDVVRQEVQVTVIYAPRDRINEEARNRGFQRPVNGFYDTIRNEIWCPNEETPRAFRTCGHELRHAVLGRFHDNDSQPKKLSSNAADAVLADVNHRVFFNAAPAWAGSQLCSTQFPPREPIDTLYPDGWKVEKEYTLNQVRDDRLCPH
jgi:hypothetical protein